MKKRRIYEEFEWPLIHIHLVAPEAGSIGHDWTNILLKQHFQIAEISFNNKINFKTAFPKALARADPT